MAEFTAGRTSSPWPSGPRWTTNFGAQKQRIWPPFMLEDRITYNLWGRYVYGAFVEFQSYLAGR